MSNKKARFTLIDLLIILVILAGCAFAGVKMLPNIGNKQKSVVKYTVLLSQKEDGFVDAIHTGDVVSISNKEKDTGTVVGFEKKTAEVMLYDSIKGEYNIKYLDNKQDVYVTIESDASVTDSLILAGSTPIKVGLEMPVRGKGYASMGYVIDVSVKEGE